jgi:DNA polymerase III epsilon subunit family exonuclease
MQLAFDAADRLVELVEERRGPVPPEEAARTLFALAHAPIGLARSLLEDVVAGDARLAWRGHSVGLAAPPGTGVPVDAARYVVVDLETTGLRPARAGICEIGAVRLDGFLPAGTFQTLVDPGLPLPAAVSSLTGLADRDLHGAPRAEAAIRRFLGFADASVLVAHNARFDLAFLDREVERLTGRRIAAPVVDTVGLARRLLAGRVARVSLASLAHFFGTSVRPCHRALPDARATAEILVALIGLAQERGAESVADLVELASPRRRRVYEKRSLAFGAPTRPGVYLFRGAGDQVLYVGRARDLRARLRSYFRSERQRPAVEAALAAVERVEWRVLGSELEAALEELRLIRELRPPANARGGRPDRCVYLKRRGDRMIVARDPPSTGRPGPSSRTCSPAAPCPACARVYATWPTAAATRTRPGFVTGSRPSRPSSWSWPSSSVFARPSSAYSPRLPWTASFAPCSWPEDGWRLLAPFRPAAARSSRSEPASPRRALPNRPSHRPTQRSSSCSPRFSADPLPSSPFCLSTRSRFPLHAAIRAEK